MHTGMEAMKGHPGAGAERMRKKRESGKNRGRPEAALEGRVSKTQALF